MCKTPDSFYNLHMPSRLLNRLKESYIFISSLKEQAKNKQTYLKKLIADDRSCCVWKPFFGENRYGNLCLPGITLNSFALEKEGAPG